LIVGAVVGLKAEARIARRLGTVAIGGGTSEGAKAAAERLVSLGAQALISFGLAGALDPALRPGALVIPRSVLAGGENYATEARLVAPATVDLLLAGERVLSTAGDKRAAWKQTGAGAVDLESGAVAETARRHGLPFAVLRAVCDPAERTLPPVALLALDRGGGIAFVRILGSLLSDPTQLPTLLRLASDARAATRTLRHAVTARP
jgi:adenosylhomocysteine nucleosidase